MTFTANTALTAAQLNTYLRDNLNETAPAKATTPGYHFVSTGVNSIEERGIETSLVATAETTTSTTYADLATTGPTVTLTTGTRALWFLSVRAENDTVNVNTYASVAVTGATTLAASDNNAVLVDGVAAANSPRQASAHLETGLTPGSNTFTVQYRCNSNTATFRHRELVVIAL